MSSAQAPSAPAETLTAHERHAVIDSPDGLKHVELPSDRYAALRTKRAFANTFYCALQAGGCGGRLQVFAGEVQVPHFRHAPGATCVFKEEPQRTGPAYAHLRFQLALQEWLAAQEISATLEKQLTLGGRADLHFSLNNRSQTIEVQLSPLQSGELPRRDRIYRRSAKAVTWLFGPLAEPLAAEQIAQRGVSLLIREQVEGESGSCVQIGTQTATGLDWSPLEACRVIDSGIWTPYLQLALHEHDLAVLKQDARFIRVQRERRLRAAAMFTERMRPPETRPVTYTDTSPGVSGTPSSLKNEDLGQPRLDLRRAGDVAIVCPDFLDWTPDQGWDWLEGIADPLVRHAAKARAYLVSRIYSSGSCAGLHFRDVDDRGVIRAALERVGFIECYQLDSGFAKWRRPGT